MTDSDKRLSDSRVERDHEHVPTAEIRSHDERPQSGKREQVNDAAGAGGNPPPASHHVRLASPGQRLFKGLSPVAPLKCLQT